MSDTTADTTGTETVVEDKATTPAETTEATKVEADKAKAEDETALPEWARARLTKANSEAARYRTSLRDAEAKLTKAKTPEEVEVAVRELREHNAKLTRDLLVEKVARSAKLPDELAELLQGSTEEELKAHAAKLQKFVTPEKEAPESLAGGLDPSEDETFDPVKAAREARKRRY